MTTAHFTSLSVLFLLFAILRSAVAKTSPLVAHRFHCQEPGMLNGVCGDPPSGTQRIARNGMFDARENYNTTL